jgi:linoleoyl-CoA desaturase
MNRLRFKNNPKSLFFATVKQRVDAHFEDGNKTRNANTQMWLKTVFFLTGFFTLYGGIISNHFSVWVMLPLAMLLGMFSAFVGFNVCHDAIHGAFSSNKVVNNIFSSIFNLLGASAYVWNITHNAVHHTYTNIPGHDEDIEIAPYLIRISPDEPIHKIQRYQHWYAFPLYSLASISWAFRKDYKKFYQAKVGNTVVKHSKMDTIKLYASKGVYYFLFIVLPLLVLDVTWWQFIIGFLAMHFAQGFTMGLVFQLAHVVEGTDFPEAGEDGNIEEAWAVHQMRTTANFASDCRFAAFFLGGLNRQVEHHLFPKVCHIHYHKIGRIVKETALEFNVPYIESPTFVAALGSHYRVLKKFALQAG